VIDKAVVQEIPPERPPLRPTSSYSFPTSLRHKMDFSPRLCVDRASFVVQSAGGREDAVNFMINAST